MNDLLAARPQRGVFSIIVAVSVCHLLNDMMQALLPAIYPTLKVDFGLTFGQVGIVTLAYQITASILQPLVGLYADRRPTPLALPGGTLFSLVGLLVLSLAHRYGVLLMGASLLGVGSSVFHPESSRVVRMAAGGRPGLGQSLFQVGGNVGQALGPLAAALVVVRWGQSSLAFFALLALVAGAILWNVGAWYKHHGVARLSASDSRKGVHPALPAATVRRGMGVLLMLVFSKYVYLASLTSYFTFYLIHRFGLSVRDAQLELFAFSAAVAAGTMLGGPFGDRIGRKRVIWFSILGTLPFTLALPYASLFWTGPLVVLIGLILASAFPAIVVFARNWRRARWAWCPGCSSDLRSGWVVWAQPRWDSSPMAGGSSAFTCCVPISQRSDYWRRCCPKWNAGKTARNSYTEGVRTLALAMRRR